MKPMGQGKINFPGKRDDHNDCNWWEDHGRFERKKRSRQSTKKEIKKQFDDHENTECLDHEIQEFFDQKYVDEIELDP